MSCQVLPLPRGALAALVLVAGVCTSWSSRADDPAPIAVAEIKHQDPVNFEQEILPLLRANCLACHNAASAKGELVLETPATIAKGGASGAAVEPNKGSESLLLAVASHQSEPIMPPADNRVGAKNFTPEELGLLKLWIDQGATGEVSAASGAPQWQPLPPGVHPVLAAAISPDAQYVACGRANQIFVYHLPTERLVARLTDPHLLAAKVYDQAGVAHLDIVQSLSFSPDGLMLASGGYREAKLWQRPEAALAGELAAGADVAALATSPDGHWLASAGRDGRVRLYNTADNAPGPVLIGHRQAVTAARFLDGETLATASLDGTIARWRVADGALLFQLPLGVPVYDLAQQPGTSTLALACDDALIRLADIAGPERTLLADAEVLRIAVSPDRQLVAAVRPTGPIDVIRLADGQLVRTLDGHADGTMAVAFLPDSQRVVSTGADKTLKVWETSRGAVTAQVALNESPTAALASAGDGSRIAWADLAGRVSVWTLGQDQSQVVHEAAGDPVSGLAASADGQTLYLARQSGQVAAVAAAETAVRWSIASGAAAASLALTADGTGLIVGGGDGLVRLFNSADGQAIAFPATPADGAIVDVAASADGRHLLVATARGEVRALLRATGQIAQVLSGPGGRSATGAFAGDLAILAANKLLTVAPLGVRQVLAGHSQAVTHVATAAGAPQVLASAGRDGSVRLWDLGKGEATRQLDMGAAVSALALRADGQRVAAAGENRLCRLWNAADGAQVAELVGDYRATQAVARKEAYVNLAKNNAETAAKLLADGRKAIDDTATELQTATAAVGPAQTAADEAGTKSKEALAAKDAATKVVADAEATLKAATDAKALAEKLANEQTALAAAVTGAADQAQAAVAAATTAQTAALAALEQLKTAVATATGDEVLKANLAAAEKIAADLAQVASSLGTALDQSKQTAATRKTIADQAVAELQAVDKRVADATAAVAAEKEKLAALDKTATDLTAAAKTTADALAAAMRKATDATANHDRAKLALPGLETRNGDATTLYERVRHELEELQQLARSREGVVRTLAFSPDGRLLAAAGDTGIMQCFSSETGTGTNAFTGPAAAVTALALLGNDQVATATAGGAIRRYGLDPAWTLLRTIGPPAEAPLAVEHSLLADRVAALAFSPDGKLLATGGGEPSRSGELKIWSVADGALVHEQPDAHSDTIFGLDFSWDGRYLASCGADKFVKVWDLATHHLSRSLEGHTHHVMGVAWRWDGQVLASGGADNAVKVWGFDTGEQIRTIGGFGKQVTGIRFVGSTPQIATSAADNNARLSNTEDGKGIRGFGGASDYLYCVGVSADGSIIVAGGADGVLRVWNAADGKQIATFAAPEPTAAAPQQAQR
ncbi:MAG: hypothetical protein K1X74_15450 [Pirellulales bacterium]|nr:hypothetical protein [Pirellulales bacterium]